MLQPLQQCNHPELLLHTSESRLLQCFPVLSCRPPAVDWLTHTANPQSLFPLLAFSAHQIPLLSDLFSISFTLCVSYFRFFLFSLSSWLVTSSRSLSWLASPGVSSLLRKKKKKLFLNLHLAQELRAVIVSLVAFAAVDCAMRCWSS